MPTHERAVFCKSFRDDFPRLKNLLASYEKIGGAYPFLLSVPKADQELIREIPLPDFVTVVLDEDYLPPGTPFQYGWLQQQICKLAVHRTDFASSYLMVDSDAYFVEPVSDDLFSIGGIPNIVCSDISTNYYVGNARLVEVLRSGKRPEPKLLDGRGSMKGFAERLAEFRALKASGAEMSPGDRGMWIPKLFGVYPGLAFQPGQIFHANLLAEFEAFLGEHALDLYKTIDLSPWEYNWYGCWLAASKGRPLPE